MTLRHLLQDLDEKPNLDLGGLLQQGIQGRGSLSFTQDTEPLLDGTEFILKVLVKRGSCHFFQCSFVLINVRKPLLSGTVQSIFRRILTLGLLIEEDLR